MSNTYFDDYFKQIKALVNKKNVDLIVNSPLFSIDFYRSRFVGDVTPDEAASDYLRYSWVDGRNPSAKFSSGKYLDRYPDVGEGKIPPLLHYELFGRKEGRIVEEAGSGVDDEAIDCGSDNKDEELAGKRYAITAHVFYPEYIEYIYSRIKEFPYAADLYFSVSSRETARQLEIQFRAQKFHSRIRFKEVAVVENRGRNFLGLFTKFSKSLLSYDFFCHVHTKKSLYTGSPKYLWCMSNVMGVLGNAAQMRTMLKVLSRSKSGILYPEKYIQLPVWAKHWLKNYDIGAGILNRAGYPIDSNGFINYPVGGMFWAKVQAIRPLLEMEISPADFPDELGQIDGTFQHALERVIGVLPEKRGYELIEYRASTGEYRVASEVLSNDVPSVCTMQLARDLIAGNDIISFDIFDTLLSRSVSSPETVRDEYSEGLKAGGAPFDYAAVRNDAEARLRAGLNGRGDVALGQIVFEMASLLGMDVEPVFKMVCDEFALDKSTMYPRHQVLELVRYAQSKGKRVIYVSDMYYGKAEITQIIAHLGIPMPSRLYLSSEEGARKDRGDMWDLIRQEYKDARILHFGDNVVSDVQNAAERGITAQIVLTPLEKVRSIKLLRKKTASKKVVEKSWPLIYPIVKRYGESPFF